MKTLSLLLALALSATASAKTASDALVAQTLAKHYPIKQEAGQRLKERSEGKESQCNYVLVRDAEEENEYCMRLHSETRDSSGKRRYLLFTGRNLNDGHAAGGLVSLFVFSGNGEQWQEVAHGYTAAGGWGEAPDEWQWQEFGPGHWGALGRSGYSQGGALEETFVILHDEGDRVSSNAILATSSYEGLCAAEDEDCRWESEAEANEQLANTSDLQATLNIRRDLAPVSNTWPLEISVSGYAGRKVSGREANGTFRLAPVKEYRQEKFLFPYDAAKHDYQTPGDYPLQMDW
mgnify:FL=1